MTKYNFLDLIYLAVCKIRSFFIFKDARLIRFPIDIRGKKHISVGKGFTTGRGCRMEAFPSTNIVSLKIGENFQMNDYVHITAMEGVSIGNNVLIASKVYISDCSHGHYSGGENDSTPLSSPKDRVLNFKPVSIEDNVWLGESVSVLPGVTIGFGTIVGANSVVSKSLPPNIIAVGAPARIIKKYNFESQKWEKYN